jgi:hypothetical protein
MEGSRKKKKFDRKRNGWEEEKEEGVEGRIEETMEKGSKGRNKEKIFGRRRNGGEEENKEEVQGRIEEGMEEGRRK